MKNLENNLSLERKILKTIDFLRSNLFIVIVVVFERLIEMTFRE
jgi:hypothetical protein